MHVQVVALFVVNFRVVTARILKAPAQLCVLANVLKTKNFQRAKNKRTKNTKKDDG